MFRTKLIGIFLGIGVSIGFSDEGYSVRLKAYSGVGSVLLDWTVQSEFPATTIKIYRSVDHQKSYQLLAEVSPENSRYLDTELMEGQTAFYFVELFPDSGESLRSKLNMEPFAQSNQFTKTGILESVPDINSGDFTDVSDVAYQVIFEFFHREFLAEYYTQYAVVSSKLSDLEKLNQWIGLVRSGLLPKMLDLGSDEKLNSFKELWAKRWAEYESIYRNFLFLTPDEYGAKGEELLEKITGQVIPEAMTILKRDLDLLRSSPPIVITRNGRINGRPDIKLFAAQDIPASALVFKNESQVIEIELINVEADSAFYYLLPKEWDHVDVLLDKQIIAHFPIASDEGSVFHFLDGEYVQTGYVNHQFFPQSVPYPTDYWLNEIYFDPGSRSLKVEVAGNSNEPRIYGLFFNEELLWELDTDIHFEYVYIDSVFEIALEDEIGGWLQWKFQDEFGNWLSHGKARPIFIHEMLMESRIPDGGRWQDVNFTTFGEPNDFRESPADELIVPEVFALFQNYPNPFNVNTAISVDLLQPAIIDLFITDAGGRKVQTFIEFELLNAGQYSFVWEAYDHSSGVYFLTIVATIEDYLPVVQSRKMIFLK